MTYRTTKSRFNPTLAIISKWHPIRISKLFPIGMLWLFLLLPQIAENQVHLEFSLTPRQKAEVLLARKDYEAAILAYKQLLSSKESRGYAVRGLVKAYQGARRMKEAGLFINQALEKASNPSDFLYGLGYWHYLEERFEDAKMFLHEAVKTDPKNALARNNLAAILSQIGRGEAALQQVKKALALNPHEAMFFKNLFLIYRNMGKPQRFQKEYEGYSASGDKDLAFGYGIVLARNLRQEGFSLYSKKQIEPAIARFEEMAKIYQTIEHISGLAATWFSLGLLYEEQGATGKALEYFEKVLSISPNHIQARERHKNLKNLPK